jgi:hypothetical protein
MSFSRMKRAYPVILLVSGREGRLEELQLRDNNLRDRAEGVA